MNKILIVIFLLSVFALKSHAQGRLPDCQKLDGQLINSPCQGELEFFGYKYVGEIKDNVRDGEGILYSDSGNPAQTGRWKGGNLVESYYIDRVRFPFGGIDLDITKLPLCPTDQGKVWSYCIGRVDLPTSRFVGVYVNNTRDGYGIEYSSSGSVKRMGRWLGSELKEELMVETKFLPFEPKDRQVATSPTNTPVGSAQRPEASVATIADQTKILKELESLRSQLQALQSSPTGAKIDEKPELLVSLTQAPRKALVIGNDKYQHVSKLANAGGDATAVAGVLKSLGYTVQMQRDVNLDTFKKSLRDFRASLDPGDEVLFYYAGHGVQLGTANYLLPVDLKGESEEQVRDDAVELQRVLDDFKSRSAKFTLAIIDACRDNPFKTTGRAIGGRGLAPTTAATGQMIMFSAGTGQQALDKLNEADKDKNGLFTRILLKEMVKPNVPVDRVLRSVRNEVVKLSRSVGKEQTPALYDQADGDFYFKINAAR